MESEHNRIAREVEALNTLGELVEAFQMYCPACEAEGDHSNTLVEAYYQVSGTVLCWRHAQMAVMHQFPYLVRDSETIAREAEHD